MEHAIYKKNLTWQPRIQHTQLDPTSEGKGQEKNSRSGAPRKTLFFLNEWNPSSINEQNWPDPPNSQQIEEKSRSKTVKNPKFLKATINI